MRPHATHGNKHIKTIKTGGAVAERRAIQPKGDAEKPEVGKRALPLNLSLDDDTVQLTPEAPLLDAAIDKYGRALDLRKNQSLSILPSSSMSTIVIRKGMLAFGATFGEGKSHIIDFLLPNDTLVIPGYQYWKDFFFRASTPVQLFYFDNDDSSESAFVRNVFTANQLFVKQHLYRSFLHQLIVSVLDSKQRVCSFLLYLFLRHDEKQPVIKLPSRDDIASYLAINADTLSRIMVQLATSGIIERAGRNDVLVKDVDALMQASTIAGILKRAVKEN
ncbi:MAG: Crp/Fnr family transcriptional regulator [Methylacidiphilales bacterium]|nr:Crp/Fnr family transcriptional regulator [Candidatus Methylacidiphilales bacterium]